MAVTKEQEIVQQQEHLASAKRALDLDAIGRIYAEDLVLTGVLGEPTCTKTAVIDEIKRGIAERERATASGRPLEVIAANKDMKVVRHGDTAIVNYQFVVPSRHSARGVQGTPGRQLELFRGMGT